MKFPKNPPVRLKSKAMRELREAVYGRDGGKCVDCGKAVIFEGGVFESMHLAHRKGRGAGGGDTLDNCDTKCLLCHIGKEHSYGKSMTKPVPPKEAA